MSNGIKCENWNIENWKFKELNLEIGILKKTEF